MTSTVAAQTSLEHPLPRLPHLRVLESEAIHILREVAAEFERPALLFSGGKDSIVLLRLAEKAFWPAKIPFPVLHIDTGHNFPEAIEFRDRRVAELGVRLEIGSVQKSIDDGRVVEETGPRASRNRLQTVTLLDTIAEHRYDALFGGARRDEERARAKERVFSFRDDFGQWDPKAQRPELWSIYNGRIRKGESVRVFPLSNWTELDVWQYIKVENIPIVPLYFAKEREVIVRGNSLIMKEQPFVPLLPGESTQVIKCRMRSLGCSPCTGAIRSDADTVDKIISELVVTKHSERQLRIIDHDQDGSMELKKREGYF
jgi:sulfate adenylyltransferase subunit 2